MKKIINKEVKEVFYLITLRVKCISGAGCFALGGGGGVLPERVRDPVPLRPQPGRPHRQGRRRHRCQHRHWIPYCRRGSIKVRFTRPWLLKRMVAHLGLRADGALQRVFKSFHSFIAKTIIIQVYAKQML